MTDDEHVRFLAWSAQLQSIIRTARSVQGQIDEFLTRKRVGASGPHKPATERSTRSSATIIEPSG